VTGWTETTLGALCELSGGDIQTGPFGSQLHASDYVADGIPSVMPQNIGDNVINPDGIALISTADADRLVKYRLRTGDIVYSRRGDVEKRALVRSENDGWLCGTGCLRVRLGGRRVADPTFLSYALGTAESRRWLVNHAVGATMPNLNTSILSGLPIRLPDIGTQQAIAEVLGALDDKIAANTRLCTIADEYLANLFSMVLEAAETRTVPLSEIAAVNAEVVRPGPGQLRYIDISAVHVGSYEYPELSDWNQAPSRARRKVSFGDTLWSTVRPNRRSHALNLHDDTDLVASTGLAVLSPINTGFAYLYEVTKRPEFSAYLETVAEGSAYPAVREDRFQVAPVPVMASQKVGRFEAVAGPLRRLAHSTRAESRTLAALRDALLPHLMSGTLSVRDAENQVEAVV
jgi:type I restriction enzyme, S subunit